MYRYRFKIHFTRLIETVSNAVPVNPFQPDSYLKKPSVRVFPWQCVLSVAVKPEVV
jgi:hypothetical protein